MTEPSGTRRPDTTPEPNRRRPAFATSRHHNLVPSLNQLAPPLPAPWSQTDTDPEGRTATYQHPDGHRIGLRTCADGHSIQTWITAGTDLPPIPDGTDIDRAEAQAANDARLQPGRTWHAVLSIRNRDQPTAELAQFVHSRLLPALTRRPKKLPTTPRPQTAPNNEGPTS